MAKEAGVSTKNKILNVARGLFAQKGFVGASIRDIAREANVNVAAVNYHFKNKNELYSHVYSETFYWIEEVAKTACSTSDSYQSAIINFFGELQKNGFYLNNTFRMFLSDEIPLGVEDICNDKTSLGPPGHIFFEKLLKKEVGTDVSDRLIKSVVNSTYALVIHWSLVCSTECYKRHYSNLEGFTLDDKIQMLNLHSATMIEILKNKNRV